MDCIIIAFTIAEFDAFLSAAHTLFGRTVSESADATRRPISEVERYLLCLKDMVGLKSLTPNLLNHAMAAVLLWGDERDLLDVFQTCSLPFVVADTVRRGVQAGVITGSLGEWQTAVVSGLQPDIEPSVRRLFSQMLARFEQAGLGHLWSDFNKKSTAAGLLLEHQ